MIDKRTDRSLRPRRSARLAGGELERRSRPGGMAQQADRLRLGRAELAEGLVRPRAAAGARGRRRRRDSSASARSASPRPASAGSPRRRCWRTAATSQKREIPAPQPDRRGHLVPVVQRARQRLRPRRRDDAGGVQGQPLGDQRPEGLDHQRASCRLGSAAGAHRLNVPKHQGLSYFVLDIHQPGVEVRPLRQMNGHASFNQVFFTDAEVPPEHLVSEVGRGWAVATTTLMHERRGADGIRTVGRGVRPRRAGSTTRSGPRSPPSWSRTSGIRSAPGGWTW